MRNQEFVFLELGKIWYSSKTQERKTEQGKLLGFSSKKILKIAF